MRAFVAVLLTCLAIGSYARSLEQEVQMLERELLVDLLGEREGKRPPKGCTKGESFPFKDPCGDACNCKCVEEPDDSDDSEKRYLFRGEDCPLPPKKDDAANKNALKERWSKLMKREKDDAANKKALKERALQLQRAMKELVNNEEEQKPPCIEPLYSEEGLAVILIAPLPPPHDEKPEMDEKPDRKPQQGKPRPEGEGSEGEGPEGEGPEGEGPEGKGPEGDRPEGERPEGEGPEGERPEGERPEGERPEGEPPEGPPLPQVLLEQLVFNPSKKQGLDVKPVGDVLPFLLYNVATGGVYDVEGDQCIDIVDKEKGGATVCRSSDEIDGFEIILFLRGVLSDNEAICPPPPPELEAP